MQWLGEAWRRLTFLFRRGQFHRDLEEEMNDHVRMKAGDLSKQGIPPEEARREARRGFGNALLLREKSRDAWGFRWLETLLQDLRYGLRQLRRNPGFGAIAILTLALGIGANTAIFSIIDAVLLHPLRFPDPGRLVEVYTYSTRFGRTFDIGVTPADFMNWREQNDAFENMVAASPADFDITGSATPVRVIGFRVTPSLFPILGVEPLLGRTFGRSNTQPGKDTVAVLGYSLWHDAFGGRRDVIGKTVRLNQQPFTIVGIMPRSFRYPNAALNQELFVPLVLTGKDQTDRRSRRLEVFARLKPGVTLARAQVEMNAIGERLRKVYPQAEKDTGVWAVPLERLPWIWAYAKPLFEPLYVAALLVLAFVCVNVASLLLAQGVTREHEIAVRATLGSGRGRIIRQLVTEGVLLSTFGAVTGIIFAIWGVDALKSLLSPGSIANVRTTHVNASALLFALVVGLITGILSSIIPGWKMSWVDPNQSLQQGGRTATASTGTRRMRNVLLLVESAITVVLLFGAGVMFQAYTQLMHRGMGFNPHRVLTFAIDVNRQRYPNPTPSMWNSFFKRVEGSVSSLPDVISAAMAERVPGMSRHSYVHFGIAGQPLPEGGAGWRSVYERASPNYFATLEQSLEKGRHFNSEDNAHDQPVVMITDTLARRYFHNQSPIGKLIDLWPFGSAHKTKAAEIVGIVQDVREYSPAMPFIPIIYAPECQDPIDTMMIVLRTRQDPRALIPIIQKRVAGVTSQPIYDIQTISQRYRDTTSFQHEDEAVFGGFALVTLLLAGIGIYGVTAHAVMQRTHEIGIRIALGASKEQILRVVIEQTAKWSLAGAALGCALLPVFRQLLAAMLGTGEMAMSTRMSLPDWPGAVTAAAIAAAFIACAAVLASWIPARRASAVDPMVALRYE
jgi:predicted permease